MIQLDIGTLFKVLDRTPESQNIMLVGSHGIGKSQILTEYYAKKGMNVVSLFLGQMSDPGDLIGLPNKDEKSGKTVFMPPFWFPVDGKPIVLFLDELNRARPEVLQTIMDLALNRKLAGRTLPEGSRLISAVNDGGEYQVVELDPALLSRFNVYKFIPSVDEWLRWAEEASIDSRVVSFIMDNNSWLDGDPSLRGRLPKGFERAPDRRSWERVSNIIKGRVRLDKTDSDLISGVVGERGASAFMASLNEVKDLSGEDILFRLNRVMPMIKESPIHVLSTLNAEILMYIDKKGMSLREKRQDAINNLLEYLLYLESDRMEAMAIFVSLYRDASYRNAMSFIAVYSPEILSVIKRFMKGL